MKFEIESNYSLETRYNAGVKYPLNVNSTYLVYISNQNRKKKVSIVS